MCTCMGQKISKNHAEERRPRSSQGRGWRGHPGQPQPSIVCTSINRLSRPRLCNPQTLVCVWKCDACVAGIADAVCFVSDVVNAWVQQLGLIAQQAHDECALRRSKYSTIGKLVSASSPCCSTNCLSKARAASSSLSNEPICTLGPSRTWNAAHWFDPLFQPTPRYWLDRVRPP